MKPTLILSSVAVAVAVAGLTVGVAMARDGGHGPRGFAAMDFDQIDTDGDGALSQSEMQAVARLRFEAADTDADGTLSAAEIETAMKGPMARRAARMIDRRDSDGDGRLSIDEMAPPPDRMARGFARLDQDESGTISREEFDAMRARMGGRGHGDRHSAD
ncbi:MAG: calcium-binding protein [Rhodobacteraceae bacterium]|nr:calcium-binding protein [Paracoccaceae bacterium]